LTNSKSIFQLFLTLLLCLPHILLAQDEISISSRVDKSRITIGDLITYTVEVVHHKNIQVEMPGVGANLGGFEIRDYHVHDPVKKEQNLISQWDYVISTFFTGEFEIPPLTIRYTADGDSTFKTLITEPIQIVVESVKPSEAGDIKDIKPPEEIPRDFWYWGRWIALGGGILLLAALAFILYRRRKAGKSLLPIREKLVRPPHEVALERLQNLKDSDLLQNGDIKNYYIELSEGIRQYIGGRYFIVAMEMTTTEVLTGLSHADILEEDYALFEKLFNRCDLVKFAKVIPPEKKHEENWQLAFDIVERTKLILTEDSPPEQSKKNNQEVMSDEFVDEVFEKEDDKSEKDSSETIEIKEIEG